MNKKDTDRQEETSKYTIVPEIQSIIRVWWGTMSKEPKKPLPDHILEKIGSELINWAYNCDEARIIGKFFRMYNIRLQTYQDWINTRPVFAAMYYDALEAIGDRREEGSLIKQYDSTTWSKTTRLYNTRMDKQWHADQEFVAKLKLDNENNETKYIILKDFPDAK